MKAQAVLSQQQLKEADEFLHRANKTNWNILVPILVNRCLEMLLNVDGKIEQIF